jgi:single-strand DNA-binding protein
MKNLRNQVTLIGHLGADPELKEFSTGTQKVSMSLATTETYKNKNGEKVTDTQWHLLAAWNGQAKYAKSYLTKGTEVMIQGKLVSRSYQDSEGKNRYITEVVVDQMMILKKKEVAA